MTPWMSRPGSRTGAPHEDGARGQRRDHVGEVEWDPGGIVVVDPADAWHEAIARPIGQVASPVPREAREAAARHDGRDPVVEGRRQQGVLATKAVADGSRSG